MVAKAPPVEIATQQAVATGELPGPASRCRGVCRNDRWEASGLTLPELLL